MTEIFFRGIGSTIIKSIKVPTDEAERAIRMIKESDTLEYGYSYRDEYTD